MHAYLKMRELQTVYCEKLFKLLILPFFYFTIFYFNNGINSVNRDNAERNL